MLIRNYARDEVDPKYDVVYHVVHVKRLQLELADEGSNIHKVNVQHIKVLN